MGNIAVVGSTMIDMVTFTHNIPQGGQTVSGEKFLLGFGGKGANQAVMIGRFGQPIYLVNALGNDVFGDSYLSQLALENINTKYVARVEKPSGVASIWVEPDGQNRIIIAPGANNELTIEYAVSAIENIPDLVAVVGQFEIPQKVTAAAFADFGAAMKDPATRLIAVEHISVNVIAVVLATIVNAKNKKNIADAAKHKNALIFNGIGLLLILSRIPWSRLFA